jgi:hypothetical protein
MLMKKYFIAAMLSLAFFSGASFATNENIINPKIEACDECTGFGCYCAGAPHNCCVWCNPPHCSKDMIPTTQTKTS